VEAFFTHVLGLLHEQAAATDPVALQRARHQLEVRELRAQENTSRRLEAAALDLFFLGRVRTRIERMEALHAVQPAQLREAFAAMLASRAAGAMTGKLPAGARPRMAEKLGLA